MCCVQLESCRGLMASWPPHLQDLLIPHNNLTQLGSAFAVLCRHDAESLGQVAHLHHLHRDCTAAHLASETRKEPGSPGKVHAAATHWSWSISQLEVTLEHFGSAQVGGIHGHRFAVADGLAVCPCPCPCPCPHAEHRQGEAGKVGKVSSSSGRVLKLRLPPPHHRCL